MLDLQKNVSIQRDVYKDNYSQYRQNYLDNRKNFP